MTDTLPDINKWSELTKVEQQALYKAYAENRPDADTFRQTYDDAIEIATAYFGSLGPFTIVDTIGHDFGNIHSKWGRERIIDRLASAVIHACMIPHPAVVRDLLDRHKAGETIKLYSEVVRCWSCGEHSAKILLRGTEITPLAFKSGAKLGQGTYVPFEPCPIDPSIPYSVEIDIPSGKMLVANHFSHIFDDIQDKWAEKFSVNYLLGRKNCSEEYAKQGYVEMNIGNCSCRLFKMNKEGSEFHMGSWGHAEDEDEVASVCTDFWGFGITDHDRAMARGLEEVCAKNPYFSFDTVKCVPGRYRFTHQYHLLKDEEDTRPYTIIERIGECTSAN